MAFVNTKILSAPKMLASMALVIGALISFQSFAASSTAPEVIAAEKYLKSMDTVRARFVQESNGLQATGTFYLDRPGKLRFEYDPPIQDYIVADGIFIYFYDSELGQQTNAPIGQTLADFLLRENISLSGDVVVKGISHTPENVNITVVQKSDPLAGALTLTFNKEPYQLKKWTVVDATGAQTDVTLLDAETDVALDSSLFVYRDQKPKGLNQ